MKIKEEEVKNMRVGKRIVYDVVKKGQQKVVSKAVQENSVNRGFQEGNEMMQAKDILIYAGETLKIV